jgi:hypothetical protein
MGLLSRRRAAFDTAKRLRLWATLRFPQYTCSVDADGRACSRNVGVLCSGRASTLFYWSMFRHSWSITSRSDRDWTDWWFRDSCWLMMMRRSVSNVCMFYFGRLCVLAWTILRSSRNTSRRLSILLLRPRTTWSCDGCVVSNSCVRTNVQICVAPDNLPRPCSCVYLRPWWTTWSDDTCVRRSNDLRHSRFTS